MNPASSAGRPPGSVLSDQRIIVTGGPSLAPIDTMRVLTNRSSGGLAIRLASALAEAGFPVEAWIGSSATSTISRSPLVTWRGFETNQDLLDRFEALHSANTPVAMIFQTAALADFEFERAEDASGRVIHDAKISSRAGNVRLVLKSAVKVLPQLRQWFSDAYICGWKFEAGDPDAARKAGRQQMQDCQTDGCVVNGPALEAKFEWHHPDGSVLASPNRESLAAAIVNACRAGDCRGPGTR